MSICIAKLYENFATNYSMQKKKKISILLSYSFYGIIALNNFPSLILFIVIEDFFFQFNEKFF